MLTKKKPSALEEGFDCEFRDPQGGATAGRYVGIIEGERVFEWKFFSKKRGYDLEEATEACMFRIEEGVGFFLILREGEQKLVDYEPGQNIRVPRGAIYGFVEVQSDTIAQETRELVKQ